MHYHSMDKRFDLMLMGAKYQLLCSARLGDMIHACIRMAALLCVGCAMAHQSIGVLQHK